MRQFFSLLTTIFLIVLILFAITQITSAQSGSWKLAGNNLAGTEKLGSKNNTDVSFISNNATRMTLQAGGKLQIGSATGNSASSTLVQIGGRTIITDNASMVSEPLLELSAFNNNCVQYFKIFDTLKAVLGFDQSTNDFVISTQNAGYSPDLIVNRATGFTGLNTKTPEARLHVYETSAISSITGTGAVEIGSTTGSNLIMDNNEMQARFNGAATTLYLNYWGGNVNLAASGGKVGVGSTSAPAITGLQVWHPSSSGALYGLRIQNEGPNNNSWTLYTQNSVGDLYFYFNGASRGAIDDVSGAYTALSDQRLKKDVEKAGDVLPGVMQLDVKKYHFLQNQSTDKKYIGMLAQEVEKIFPEVVYHKWLDDGSDLYTMDYSAFGVIAIKAIQEMNGIIEEKDAKISDLQKQIDDIKSSLQACGITCFSESKENSDLSNQTKLYQNEPNPANETTTIRFNIPTSASNSQIIITDAFGKTLQQYNNLTGTSQIEFSTAKLSSGTYQYSLYIDGRKVDTKQMIISK